MKKTLLVSVLLGYSLTGYAFTTDLTLSNAQQCQAFIKQCPLDGPLPSLNCVNEVLQENDLCEPLAALAEHVNLPAAAIDISSLGPFVLVTQNYIADGGKQYQLITPAGKLINLMPTDNQLESQYGGRGLLAVPQGPPKLHALSTSRQQVIMIFDVKQGCRTCLSSGLLQIAWTFSQEGEWINTAPSRIEKQI